MSITYLIHGISKNLKTGTASGPENLKTSCIAQNRNVGIDFLSIVIPLCCVSFFRELRKRSQNIRVSRCLTLHRKYVIFSGLGVTERGSSQEICHDGIVKFLDSA